MIQYLYNTQAMLKTRLKQKKFSKVKIFHDIPIGLPSQKKKKKKKLSFQVYPLHFGFNYKSHSGILALFRLMKRKPSKSMVFFILSWRPLQCKNISFKKIIPYVVPTILNSFFVIWFTTHIKLYRIIYKRLSFKILKLWFLWALYLKATDVESFFERFERKAMNLLWVFQRFWKALEAM